VLAQGVPERPRFRKGTELPHVQTTTRGAVAASVAMVAGAPGTVRRESTDDEVARVRADAQSYVELSRRHAEA
jgi:carbonic anhydrase/acetyltransferase-like protein (isoleucine patch superfamily)